MREQLKKDAELVASFSKLANKKLSKSTYDAMADLIARQDAYIDGLGKQIQSNLTDAYNFGVAAGMLRNKADRCTLKVAKNEYLQRMDHFYEKFENLCKSAPEQLTKREE